MVPDLVGLPRWLRGTESACQFRRQGFHLWVRKDPPVKVIATCSSILAWEIAWLEEPGGLQSMGVTKDKQNLETKQQQQRDPVQNVVFLGEKWKGMVHSKEL